MSCNKWSCYYYIIAVQLLSSHGPVPVGEVGKLLQEATGNAQLPAMVKEMFGGLKKFLEAHPHLFRIGTDHPFNPLVSLQVCYLQKHRCVRD